MDKFRLKVYIQYLSSLTVASMRDFCRYCHNNVSRQVLSRLGLVWTVARFAWGLIALTSVLQGWLTQAKRSKLFYTIVLVSDRVNPHCFNNSSIFYLSSGFVLRDIK